MELTPFFFGLYKFVKYGLYPLTWVLLLLSAATVLALRPFSPTNLKWLRRLVISSLLLLVMLSSPLVATLLIGSLESWHRPPQLTPSDRFDAIVVLGGGVHEKGALRPTTELSSHSRERVTCAMDLYQQGYASILVLTGGDARIFGKGPEEAVEMKRWALRLGLPESAAMIDSGSRNTYENATGTKRLIGPASILLVSSASHLPRAVPVFAKQGFQVTPAPCDYVSQNLPREILDDIDLFDFLPDDDALKHSTEAVSEMAGLVIYWLAGKL
ncbi:MAG: YdcF family protein [Nitrospirae bacterium]|nr:YdcF family protein [Nitrospirota bacterium]